MKWPLTCSALSFGKLMQYKFFTLIIALLSSILASCSYVEKLQGRSDDKLNYDPIVVRVSGYGTYEDPSHAKSARHRLLAMRASKLDAYRSLVERIYGTIIFGNSTVNSLVLKHDEFRAAIDSVIRGARVLSVSDMRGGGYETVLEVVLSSRFRQCLTNVNYFRYTEECRMPIPHSDPTIRASMDSPSVSKPTSKGSGLYYLDSTIPNPSRPEY